jgi:hypothetical protein
MQINHVAQTKHCACCDRQFRVSTQSLSFVLCHDICDPPAVSSVQPTQECYKQKWQRVIKKGHKLATGAKAKCSKTNGYITGAMCIVHIFQVIHTLCELQLFHILLHSIISIKYNVFRLFCQTLTLLYSKGTTVYSMPAVPTFCIIHWHTP